ncbi:glucose-6-phosphate isomerase [Alisedimentitalea sp. MJ-SS2]|uniref:glucose-6-phosphate isomerase n=1 Tax=Aliisedimentitalea sp. MJ-SS2 TaxID=3049795 RepID=UPI002912C4D9|nr:glucose-6-phosphate isomerase [Alisedimentitalea sp. MJ-SS2]MDU8928629.1 glucose-6-phosphate isomerase [Alisedimentitalea sp. MJ-SS2]
MTDIWQQLDDIHAATSSRRIVSLFDDPARFDRFSATTDDLLLDFSKTNIDDDVLSLLISLAMDAGLQEKRAAMFRGDKINSTENRAVLHSALRSRETASLVVDGVDVRPAIADTLTRMEIFADAVRSGEITAHNGGRFTDVVNIGIGGSDLGPVMATLALAPYHDGPRCHFISNVDGAHASDIFKRLDPQTTLVIVASKTFTTIETMTNADTVLSWLRAGIGPDVGPHLAAVSTAHDLTAKMGISPDRVFGFADWVGGRYSLWGPVGLPIMLAVGPEHFRALLAGGYAMDRHFQTAEPRQNLPVLMALIGIWHRNICNYATRAVLPYDQRLSRLPAYLQQLDMESNGKGVALDGSRLSRRSGPVVWGEPGTNGQHAFFQLMHQGTDVIPAEFLIAAQSHEPNLQKHHELLKANCLAQSEALMLGRAHDQAMEIAAKLGLSGDEQIRQAAHRTFPGNRPSITLAYPKLTPFVLGQIIALYEHRVFVEGVIWGLNSFDQWGVELGKELSNTLLPMVQGASSDAKDASTRGLLLKLTT